MKKNSNKNNRGVLSDPLDYSKYSIECKSTDKTSFKITREFLEKLCKEAKISSKKPLLLLEIPKDDNNMFELRCEIIIKRKEN